MINLEKIKAAFFGAAAGDALGVPVEFVSREALVRNPVSEMRGNGTHHQPAGTWSDDSSLLFCTAESLCLGYSLEDMGRRFADWLYRKYWTPHEEIFDVGNATRAALERLKNGIPPGASGLTGEHDNGNGSLMRILPLVFFLAQEKDENARMRMVREVSSITHAHPVSWFACWFYVITGIRLLEGKTPAQAYKAACTEAPAWSGKEGIREHSVQFGRLLTGGIASVPEAEIRSGGYVVHTLEAALWCLLTSETYSGTVLKAVNLGGDTDTTACVAGGLAGLHYGLEAIPADWMDALARKPDIEDLVSRFGQKLAAV